MLRRNGKPRSCEPCRLSKIRCDHTVPICQKCQTRGIADQCFVHPAPMTKPTGTPRKQPEARRRVKPKYSETHASRGHGSSSFLPSPTTTPRNDVGTGTMPSSHACSIWPMPPESAAKTTQSVSESARSFFLGSTSYASVFAEEHPLPDSLHEQPPKNLSTTHSVYPTQTTGTRHCQMGIALAVISKFAPFSLFDDLVRMYFEVNKAAPFVGPLITSALPQLRIDVERLFQRGDGADTCAAYTNITKNTTRPLKVPPSMLASEFHTLYTGENLRWETLGMMMSIAGSIAQFTPPDDPVFALADGERIDKDIFIEDMIHGCNDCISLCQVHGAVNDIIIWTMYSNMLVMSNFYGDNYHGVWRRMGDCISALYAKGIHCEENSDEPFFLREARRRIYSSVYRSDKTLATFYGRPPMMSNRYNERKQPLDIDDDLLAASDPELVKEALSRLDSNGWDTEGTIRSVSWIKLRGHISEFKEAFLEQSLAGKRDGDIAQKLQAISTNCRLWWTESVPAHLRYDLYDEDVAWSLKPGVALRMVSSYLDYLHLEFQMQRMLRRQTQTALPGLLEISMKLLSTVMVFNKQRNQTYNVQRHFPSIILFYCLPSAGVLALELHRCTLENVPLPSTVSRADLIRNLSVLISCLESVILPGDGNDKLCSELNKMLAMVLDEVLNHQPAVNGNQGDGSGGGLGGGVGAGISDMPLIDGMEPIPTESEDFLNWLDNANWNNTYLF